MGSSLAKGLWSLAGKLGKGLKKSVVKNAKAIMHDPKRQAGFTGAVLMGIGNFLKPNRTKDEVDATVTPNVRRYQQGEDY